MRKEYSVFGTEIRKSAERFFSFAKSHKGVISILALWLLFLYGVRIFYYDISIDSEAALSSQQELLDPWLTIDRFGLVFTKKLFFMSRFVPYVSNFLMILALGCSAFFFDFCVEEWRGKDSRYRMFFYIFPIAYVSAPCLAEQFFFTLQSFEIAWAGLLCMAAVYCFSRWLFYQKSFLWIIPGTVFMVWSFGSYQAFASLFLSVALVSFLLSYQNPSVRLQEKKSWLFCCLKYVTVFCVGLLLYVMAGKIIRLSSGIEATDYVNNMYFWNSTDFRASLRSVLSDCARVYLGYWPEFFHWMFAPAMLICSLLLLRRGRKMERNGFPFYVAALALLVLSPVFLSFISGSHQPLRGQFSYVFVFAFFLAGMTTLTRKSLAILCCLAGVFVSLQQGQRMTQLFHTAFVTYNQDKALAASLYERISQTAADAGLEEYPVVFVGTKSANFTEDARKGEMIGASFFEWDASSYCGSTNRIIDFCDTLGYDMEKPTQEQASFAQTQAVSMPVWPAAGSVKQMNGIVIIKLSDAM